MPDDCVSLLLTQLIGTTLGTQHIPSFKCPVDIGWSPTKSVGKRLGGAQAQVPNSALTGTRSIAPPGSAAGRTESITAEYMALDSLIISFPFSSESIRNLNIL